VRWVEYEEFELDEEFEPGDKVRLGEWVNIEWFKKYEPKMVNTIMTVKFQDGDDVWTDKGIVDYNALELVEEI